MTPAARLATTIDALAEIWTAQRPADTILAKYFRARRFIGSKDRAAIAGAIYRILRSQARLTWHLARCGFTPAPRALALADALLSDSGDEGIAAADLEALCNGGQYAPSALSAHERDMTRQLDGQQLTSEEMPAAVRLECPEWAEAMLYEAYGDRAEAVLAAMLHPAPLDLRVNTLKADRETLLREFEQVGWDIEPCKYTPEGIRLRNRPDLNAHPALKEGLAEIQDEGSQLVALAVAAKPGMRVLDFCAGAGGKTLAMAAGMQNKGRIIACDVLAGRLKRSALRLRRAGVQNVDLQPLKTESDPWLKRHKDGFDRVLVDAPCSGAGTWRRNPESRWRQLGPDLTELTRIQSSILDSAARLVKPGGRLIYATCSLLPIENQRQVEAFLERHSGYALLPITSIWAEEWPALECPVNADMLTLNPADHATDGFFAAVLVRNAVHSAV